MPTKIVERDRNPLAIERLLRYDRPDVIVVVNGVPNLMVEKTSDMPTGHTCLEKINRKWAEQFRYGNI